MCNRMKSFTFLIVSTSSLVRFIYECILVSKAMCLVYRKGYKYLWLLCTRIIQCLYTNLRGQTSLLIVCINVIQWHMHVLSCIYICIYHCICSSCTMMLECLNPTSLSKNRVLWRSHEETMECLGQVWASSRIGKTWEGLKERHSWNG
jgi:hypothetical protein